MPTTNDEQINTFCDQIADVFGEDIVDNPAFEELWENPKFLKIIGTGHVESISQIRELMKKGEQVQEPSKARKRMWGKFFESLGIDERQKNDIRASWQAIRDEKGDLATPKRDIKVMTELFAERPDALSSLYKHFGIRNFGRYGSKLLLEQLDDLEQGKLADYLTLVISARDDWNGSMDHFPRTLSRNEDMTTPDDVSEQMLFVEAATPTEMLRRLVSISRKFKAVDRLVVSGHGYKHGIQFSSNDELTSEMVESSIAATRLIDRGIINPNIEIILKSCSVGKEGGIAQTISRKLGVHVTAAPENVSQTSSVERKMIDKVLRRKNPRRGTHYLQWESDGKPIRANQYHAGEKQRDVRRIRF